MHCPSSERKEKKLQGGLGIGIREEEKGVTKTNLLESEKEKKSTITNSYFSEKIRKEERLRGKGEKRKMAILFDLYLGDFPMKKREGTDDARRRHLDFPYLRKRATKRRRTEEKKEKKEGREVVNPLAYVVIVRNRGGGALKSP